MAKVWNLNEVLTCLLDLIVLRPSQQVFSHAFAGRTNHIVGNLMSRLITF